MRTYNYTPCRYRCISWKKYCYKDFCKYLQNSKFFRILEILVIAINCFCKYLINIIILIHNEHWKFLISEWNLRNGNAIVNIFADICKERVNESSLVAAVEAFFEYSKNVEFPIFIPENFRANEINPTIRHDSQEFWTSPNFAEYSRCIRAAFLALMPSLNSPIHMLKTWPIE